MRKRVARRRILPGDAVLEDVILLPDAIDVDVDGAAILRAALDARIAVAAGDELHPRRDVRERQEVAVVLRPFDRKGVVEGKGVDVRVDLGGSGSFKQKK